MRSDVPGGCSGRACDFGAFAGNLGCDNGSGSCWAAMMAEAKESTFHDKALQEATGKINEILKGIEPDPDGRTLSFVHTEDGTILAWVDHGTPFPAGTVTLANGRDEVRNALNLVVPSGK